MLLVEDNPVNQEVQLALLGQLGVDVVCAANGPQALDLLKQQAFDVIILDIQLPQMDGYALMAAIKAQGVMTPVVALTAAVSPEEQARGLASGMDDYLGKPVDIVQLHAALSRWLAVSKTPITAGVTTAKAEGAVVATSQTPEEDLLHAAAGIGRLMGNQALYCKLLKQLHQQLQGPYTQLSTSLQSLNEHSVAADFVVAQSLAHSLKGVAGNLAMSELADVAGELDHLLRKHQVPAPALIANYGAMRQRISAQAADYIAQNEEIAGWGGQPDAQTDQHDVMSMLAWLSLAIKGSQFVAEDVLTATARSLPADLRSKYWPAIESALDALDFDAADTALEALISALKAD